jgi:hypothetical protein
MLSARADGAPVLGMWGSPPPEKLAWHGLGRRPLSDRVERIDGARTRGTWLRLSCSLSLQPPGPASWHTTAALLRLIEPHHRLPEDGAGRRLVEVIEAHAARLDWPAVLLASDIHARPSTVITLGHPLTTFVALSKASGSLWLCTRRPRLGALQCPRVDAGSSSEAARAYWEQFLWFPDGLPSTLLQPALDHTRRRRAVERATA